MQSRHLGLLSYVSCGFAPQNTSYFSHSQGFHPHTRSITHPLNVERMKWCSCLTTNSIFVGLKILHILIGVINKTLDLEALCVRLWT